MSVDTLPPINTCQQNTFVQNSTQQECLRSGIPIIHHVISDQDIGLFKDSSVPPITLDKVVKLLTDPHSANLCDRHIHTLKKVATHYKNGFIMKDLVLVFKILNILADRVQDVPRYAEPMAEFLRLCSLPYLKEKESDEMAFEQIAIESTDQLGYLMRVPDRCLRLQICDTLKKFYCARPSQQRIEKYKQNLLTYNQMLVEKSDIAVTLTKSLSLVDDDPEVRLAVLGLLRLLSQCSALNCDKILSGCGAYQLCSHLMDVNDPTGKVLFNSIDILWNLLEYGSTELLCAQLNDVECISQLRDAFIEQTTQGTSCSGHQLRNDLLVLASLIASVCSCAPFVETGFVKQLAVFATFEEVKSHNALVKHFKLTKNSENFEFKKLLINLMVVLSRNPAAIPVLSEGRVLLALFSYVSSNEMKKASKTWSPAQYEEIQLHAIAALATLAPLMVEDFMVCQGSTRLLLFLEWCIGSDKYAGFGNGFHAVGGCGNKRAQLRHTLRVIRSVASTLCEVVLDDLTEQGAITQLVSVLDCLIGNRCQGKSLPPDDAVDVEMQTDILVTIATICQHELQRKEKFGKAGVNVLVKFLKMDINLLSAGLGHFGLLVSAINCVWCAVVGCFDVEDYFLEKDGVFLLLDLIESTPHSLHSQILGCFLDLAENQKTLSHIAVWRGKDNVSAPHLFCEIWREEEKRLGVIRDEYGAIADLQKPLLSRLQDCQAVIPLPANCPSQSIVDVSENLRAKLYSIFNKIGFVELPGLTGDDHVTLTVIEHYLDLKMGEVWTEIMSELGEECIRPITPDREAIEAICSAINIRTEQIADVQKDLIEAQTQQDLIDEQEFYAEVRERHRLKEKELQYFAEFLARTSSYKHLRTAKERQTLAIDASRVQTNYKSSANFHRTEVPKVNITAFTGRSITVESTPAALTGGALVNYDPDTGTLEPRFIRDAESEDEGLETEDILECSKLI